MSTPQPPSTRPDWPTERRESLAHYYAEHARWMERVVARRAKAPHATIEEACQTAWMQLAARPDITLDDRGLNWLVVVATREAWRLATTRERPVGAFAGRSDDEPFEREEPAGPASDPLELVIAHELHEERLQAFATLKPRERRELFLQALGYRYRELALLTGTSYTAVNRRINEGRKNLRAATQGGPDADASSS